MRVKIAQSIAIEGEIIPLDTVVEVPNQLGKELIWRGAATAVRYRPPEKAAEAANPDARPAKVAPEIQKKR